MEENSNTYGLKGESPDFQNSSGGEYTSGQDLNKTKQRNKRKYNFQRASVACEQCRKAKTRCNYLQNGTTCFRCENLSLKCSLNDTNVEPVLSKFQSSANISVRDTIGKKKIKKKRKIEESISNINSIQNSHSTPTLSVDAASIKSEFSSVPLNSSPSPFNSNENYALLSTINNKIDVLQSTLNSIMNKSNSDSTSKSNSTLNSDLFLNTPLTPAIKTFNQQNVSKNDVSTFQRFYPPQLLPSISNHPQISSNNPTTLLSSSIPSILSPPITAPLARPYLQPSSNLLPDSYRAMVLNNNNTKKVANNNGGKTYNIINNPSTVHENDEFFFLNAPYLDVINTSSTVGLPFSKEIGFDISRDTVLLSIQERYDLINRKLIDYDTCYNLMEIAIKFYGKWISYVETDYKRWFDTIRVKSPLLFCTLVLFGLRHHKINEDKSGNLELDILQSIHQLLSLSIYEIPQSKEFLQSCILLTHFAPSLSFKHIYFDGWWISSYGLIHFMTFEMTINLLVKSVKSPEKICQYRIWNHLTISHLINCILSGRPCIIDEIRLDQCRDILDLPEANSFDAVIVAELCITLSLYNSLQFPEDIEVSLNELNSTYSDWKYLTEKISSGVAVTGFYYFSRMMILRRYILKNLYLKGQIEFTKKCRELLNCAVTLSNFIEQSVEIGDCSDLLKQCTFICFFMVLQFRQMDLLNEPEDASVILRIVDQFLQGTKKFEKETYFYNGYYDHYSELLIRMRNLNFPNAQK